MSLTVSCCHLRIPLTLLFPRSYTYRISLRRVSGIYTLSEMLVESLQPRNWDVSALGAFLLLFLAWFTSQALLFLYRITIHPLARFPGPIIAGLTYWYEYYYDVSKEGRYLWKIIELHEKYGTFCIYLTRRPHYITPHCSRGSFRRAFQATASHPRRQRKNEWLITDLTGAPVEEVPTNRSRRHRSHSPNQPQ